MFNGQRLKGVSIPYSLYRIRQGNFGGKILMGYPKQGKFQVRISPLSGGALRGLIKKRF
jgi:hypothetical protein